MTAANTSTNAIQASNYPPQWQAYFDALQAKAQTDPEAAQRLLNVSLLFSITLHDKEDTERCLLAGADPTFVTDDALEALEPKIYTGIGGYRRTGANALHVACRNIYEIKYGSDETVFRIFYRTSTAKLKTHEYLIETLLKHANDKIAKANRIVNGFAKADPKDMFAITDAEIFKDKLLNSEDSEGETPLDIAAETGTKLSVQMLIDGGVRTYTWNRNGRTALMAAITAFPGDVTEGSQLSYEKVELILGSAMKDLSTKDFPWMMNYVKTTIKIPGFTIDLFKIIQGYFVEDFTRSYINAVHTYPALHCSGKTIMRPITALGIAATSGYHRDNEPTPFERQFVPSREHYRSLLVGKLLQHGADSRDLMMRSKWEEKPRPIIVVAEELDVKPGILNKLRADKKRRDEIDAKARKEYNEKHGIVEEEQPTTAQSVSTKRVYGQGTAVEGLDAPTSSAAAPAKAPVQQKAPIKVDTAREMLEYLTKTYPHFNRRAILETPNGVCAVLFSGQYSRLSGIVVNYDRNLDRFTEEDIRFGVESAHTQKHEGVISADGYYVGTTTETTSRSMVIINSQNYHLKLSGGNWTFQEQPVSLVRNLDSYLNNPAKTKQAPVASASTATAASTSAAAAAPKSNSLVFEIYTPRDMLNKLTAISPKSDTAIFLKTEIGITVLVYKETSGYVDGYVMVQEIKTNTYWTEKVGGKITDSEVQFESEKYQISFAKNEWQFQGKPATPFNAQTKHDPEKGLFSLDTSLADPTKVRIPAANSESDSKSAAAVSITTDPKATLNEKEWNSIFNLPKFHPFLTMRKNVVGFDDVSMVNLLSESHPVKAVEFMEVTNGQKDFLGYGFKFTIKNPDGNQFDVCLYRNVGEEGSAPPLGAYVFIKPKEKVKIVIAEIDGKLSIYFSGGVYDKQTGVVNQNLSVTMVKPLSNW